MTTIQKIPAIIKRAVRTGTNVHLIGHPGIGKTQIIEQTVRDIQTDDPNFKLFVVYTPAMSPLDFVAVVPDMVEKTLDHFHNSSLPNRYVTPDMKGILFLGERDNADPATNKALLKYTNNEDMGGLQKPEGVIVVSDSNCIGHKSGVNQQPLSLVSRSRNLNVECDPDEFLKHLSAIGGHPTVQAYLLLRREHVDTFAKTLESRHYGSWANPRAWVRLSNALIDADSMSEEFTEEEIIGDIGEAVGREFIGFMTATRTLVSMDKILKSPAKAKKPEKMADVYAVIAMVASNSKPDNMDPIIEYVKRFDLEVHVLYLRLLSSNKTVNRHEIANTKAYKTWLMGAPELTNAILY